MVEVADDDAGVSAGVRGQSSTGGSAGGTADEVQYGSSVDSVPADTSTSARTASSWLIRARDDATRRPVRSRSTATDATPWSGDDT